VGIDDPLDPSRVENLRRSIVMLGQGQEARIDRNHALVLLRRLQELEGEHQEVISELRGLLARLEGGS
jgi:hypothetical protein